jgi:hypothetical protein
MNKPIRPAGPLFAAAAGLLLALPLQAQNFEGVVSVHSATMPPQAGMQYFIKGDRLRLEISAPGKSPIVMISDGPARKQYILFTDQKVYTTTSLAELMRTTDPLRKESARLLRDASMTPLGTTATVAGHRCAMHRYRDAKTVNDICLTTELGALGGLGGLFGNVGRSTDPTDPPQWAQKFLKAGSFALRIADTAGNSIWEVRKVEAKTLDSGLFAPPAGFVAVTDSSAKSKRPSLR